MEILDSHTIKFNLTSPSIGFPATMYSAASAQVPMCAPESVNAEGKISHPIGTGAFEFVEWKQNEYLKVKKNPNYRVKGLPYIDEVFIRFIPDETTRLAALQSGELDLAIDLGSFQVEGLSKNQSKGLVLNQDVLSSMGFIHFNAAKPPFNDARVRQAVAYGINKEEIAQAIWGERAAFGNQPMMPASPFKLNVPDITRDPEKAKKLLKEAGYPNGLEVVLTSSSGYWMYLVAIEVILEQLKEVGIKIKIETSDWPTYVGNCLKGEFTMGYAGWPLDWDPVFTYSPCFTKGGAYSFLTGRAYENPELTKLLEAADQAIDLEKRKNYFAQAVEIITKDAPWIFIGYGPAPMGLQSSVKGLKTHIAGLYISPMNGFQYVWLDK
jgi:peptide/nickel transport system substrate-binding protein